MSNSWRLIFLAIIMVFFSGCASFTASSYSPHYETIDRLKKLNIEKMAVGEVKPRDPNALVNKITLRGAALKAPSGTFSTYLENAIRSDLMEMGLYDATSTTLVDTTILKNYIDISGLSTGYGAMDVKIAISKKGVISFEKSYSVNIQFESSFAGAVAIPKGQNEYPNLVRTLLQQVYIDPAFIEAIKK